MPVKVLIIDDSAVVRKSLEKELSKDQVKEAVNQEKERTCRPGNEVQTLAN